MDIEHQNAEDAAADKDKHSVFSYDDAIAAVGKELIPNY